MLTLLLFFFFFLPCVLGVFDVTHYTTGFTTGVRDNPIHASLIITARLDATQRADWAVAATRLLFFEAAKTATLLDGCVLSASGVGPTAPDSESLVMRLVCTQAMDNATETDDIPPLAELRLVMALWRFTELSVSVNRESRSPFWYGGGTAHQLEAVMESYKARKSHPLNFRGAQDLVQSPAPWNLDRVDMHFGLLDNEYVYTEVGTNVDVYVIDTGVRLTHQEFQGRAAFLANTVGDGINTDCAGHGTHVASVVGGATYGVAKQVRLYAVKVLDCAGNGDVFTIMTGAMAVVAHRQSQSGRAAVASLSLGGDASTALNQAMLSILSAGISVVVAAGNENRDACNYSPSQLSTSSNVITVGASTVMDQRPSYSNYGQCVSISAPGSQIIGASHQSDTGAVILSGTSMATPHVSGILALILSQDVSLTTATVKQTLLSWATPFAIAGTTAAGGAKHLAYSRITLGQPPDFTAVTPPPPSPSPDGLPSSATVTRTTSLLLLLFTALIVL